MLILPSKFLSILPTFIIIRHQYRAQKITGCKAILKCRSTNLPLGLQSRPKYEAITYLCMHTCTCFQLLYIACIYLHQICNVLFKWAYQCKTQSEQTAHYHLVVNLIYRKCSKYFVQLFMIIFSHFCIEY